MRRQLKFMIVLLIVGFMIAIQYNTIQKPEKRDTRDMWAIRNELSNEKKLHSELLKEIRGLDETIRTYESLSDENTGQALKETVEKLHAQAGMTDTEGPGLVIEVEPSPESIALGIGITSISPDLLTRFVNELNRVKWRALEIDGKRYTSLSAIRDINGFTTVNGLNVASPPFTIKVITDTSKDSEMVYNTLQASAIHDDFYLDDLVLRVGEPVNSVKIRGWKESVKNLYLNELPKGE
ncbi:DUF881 domain-containing protein [Sporosarcina pasteurii]|uniref:Bacterial protein of uncharacterized function (DUF881) n=1 Tax=Sporosarcina pasteurii TaxID=1474 RepID=A0A380BG29_SPOPA|nr:DUF881 domain-containing protein [Sporosarcina pasteurii]MDS9470500.1 DUF881 domain-containing protein [Sporosarcina pasteurii]QBQ05804.1 DUF881 domain-containing protein [Sporosarcina pasteurii]SUJ00422.1 Bacterial protein of uncharacterised function (DUF881) [Sporosarcina pasteurii]